MLYFLGLLFGAWRSWKHNRNHIAVLTLPGHRDAWHWVLQPHVPQDSPVTKGGEGKVCDER